LQTVKNLFRVVFNQVTVLISNTGGDKVVCPRCSKQSFVHTTSILNADEICLQCKAIERRHPLYLEAQQAEIEAVKQGAQEYQGLFTDKSWEQIKDLDPVSSTK
jgi:hypothetical protein